MIKPKRKVEVNVSIIWLSLTLAMGIKGLGTIWPKWGIAKRNPTNNAVAHGFTLDPAIIGNAISAKSTPLTNWSKISPGVLRIVPKV